MPRRAQPPASNLSASRSPSRLRDPAGAGRPDQPSPSLNALGHGLSPTPSAFLARLTPSERQLYRQHLQHLIAQLQPTSYQETLLVEQMALAHLRLARCALLEAILFERIRPLRVRTVEDLPPQLPLLLPYQSAAQRTLYRALAAFRLGRQRLNPPALQPSTSHLQAASAPATSPVQKPAAPTSPFPHRQATSGLQDTSLETPVDPLKAPLDAL